MSFIDNPYNNDEAQRALLWQQERANRFAFRGFIERTLLGNAQAGLRLVNKFMPLLDAKYDAQMPADPDDEDMETTPITNQGLNL